MTGLSAQSFALFFLCYRQSDVTLASRLQSSGPDSEAASLMDVGEFASERGIAIHGLRRLTTNALYLCPSVVEDLSWLP